MAMTRKDWVALANAIKNAFAVSQLCCSNGYDDDSLIEDVREHVVDELCDMYSKAYPQFKRGKFKQACGIIDYVQNRVGRSC